MLKNIKFRVLPLLLALSILLSMVPATVFAAEEPWDGKSIIVNSGLSTGTIITARKQNAEEDDIGIKFVVQDLEEKDGKIVRYAISDSDIGLINGTQYSFYTEKLFHAQESASENGEGVLYTWLKATASNTSAKTLIVEGIPTVSFEEKDKHSFKVTVASCPEGADLRIRALLGIYDTRTETTKWYEQETRDVVKQSEGEFGATFKCYSDSDKVRYKFEIVSDIYAAERAPEVCVKTEQGDAEFFYYDGEKKITIQSLTLRLKSDVISLPVEYSEGIIKVVYKVGEEEILLKDENSTNGTIQINRKKPGELYVEWDWSCYLKTNFNKDVEVQGKTDHVEGHEEPKPRKVTFSLEKYIETIEELECIKLETNRKACVSKLTVSDGGKVKLNNYEVEFRDETAFLRIGVSQERNLTFTADKGYEIQELLVGNQLVSNAVGKETYNLPLAAGESYDIKVAYAKKTYTVTWSSKGNGTTAVNGNEGGTLEVKHGDDITFVLKANDGYRIKSLQIDNKQYVDPVTGEEKKWTREDTEFSGSFKASGKHTIDAEFEAITYEVTLNINEENWGKAECVDANGKVYLYFLPNSGHGVQEIYMLSAGERTDLDWNNAPMDVTKQMLVIVLDKPQNDITLEVKFNEANVHKPNLDDIKNATQGDGQYYTVTYTPTWLRVEPVSSLRYDYYVLVKSGTSITFKPKQGSGYTGIELNKGVSINWPWGDYKETQTITVNKDDTEPQFIDHINVNKGGWGTWQEVSVSMIFLTDKKGPTLEISSDSAAEIVVSKKGYTIDFTAKEEDDDLANNQMTSGLDKLVYSIYDEIAKKYVKKNGEIFFNTLNNSNKLSVYLPDTSSGYGKYIITAEAYDKAGNGSGSVTQTITVSTKKPEVAVSFDPTGMPVTDSTGLVWYKGMKATVVVDDYSFAKETMEDALKKAGLRWNELNWTSSDGHIHTAEIALADGEYNIIKEGFSYINSVENETQEIQYSFGEEEVQKDLAFCVDGTAPEVEVKVETGEAWTTLLEVLCFDLFTNDKEFEITADVTNEANLASVRYVRLSGKEVRKYDLDQDENLEKWLKSMESTSEINWTELTVESDNRHFDLGSFTADNEELVVIVAATDKAGNTTYMSTTGLVLDTTKPTVEIKVTAEEIPDGDGKRNKYTVSFEVEEPFVTEPTTEAPTEEPTTEAPTEEPTTEAPIEDPTTEAPTTEEPTEETTEAVTTEEPTTEEPVEDQGEEVNAAHRNAEADGTSEMGIASGIKMLHVTVYNIEQEQNPIVKYDWKPEEIKTLVFDSKDYSGRDVKVFAYAEDYAGNCSEVEECTLDTHTPTMVVQSSLKDAFKKEYYKPDELSVIIIIEDEKEAFREDNVKITLTHNDKEIDADGVEWETISEEGKVDDQHIGTITFKEDGMYTLSVQYASCESETYTFWIDGEAPVASIDLRKTVAETLFNTVTMGLVDWIANGHLEAYGKIDDNIGIASIGYLKQYVESGEFSVYTVEQLQSMAAEAWKAIPLKDGVTDYKLEELQEDGFFAVYLKVVDKAGNTTYCCEANTVMIDKTKPELEIKIEDNTWVKLCEFITFGLFKQEETTVYAKVEEGLSGIEVAEYLVQNHDGGEQLEKDIPNEGWVKIENCPVGEQFELTTLAAGNRYTVYLRVTDKAGNKQIVNTDGLVIDGNNPEITVNVVPVSGKNGADIYNGNVNLEITAGGTCNGLQKVYLYFPQPEEEPTEDDLRKAWDDTADEHILFSYKIEGDRDNRTVTVKDISHADKGYTLPAKSPIYEQLQFIWEGTYLYEIATEQVEDVKIYVCAEDNAGNFFFTPVNVAVDNVAPVVYVRYKDTFLDQEQTAPLGEFYSGTRTLFVEVTERYDHFVAENIVAELHLNGSEEVDQTFAEAIKVANNWVWDEKNYQFVFTYAFENDGKYAFTDLSGKNDGEKPLYIQITDKANNTNVVNLVEENANAGYFVLDKIPMTVKVSAMENTWEDVIEVLTFGLFSREREDIEGNANDETTTLREAYYYIDNESRQTPLDPKNIEGWEEISFSEKAFELNEDFYVTSLEPGSVSVVYLKVVDMAGNVSYASTNGIIVDNTAPVIQSGAITVNGKDVFQNDTVTLDISLLDADTVSGIGKITLHIEETVSGDKHEIELYSCVPDGDKLLIQDRLNGVDTVVDDRPVPTYQDLLKSWRGTYSLNPVDMGINCVTKVYLSVTDMAGNKVVGGEDTAVAIDFDLTAPNIEVTYHDHPVRVENGVGYFDKERTATVRIYERNGHLDMEKMADIFKTSCATASGDGKMEINHNAWDFVENTKDPDKSYYENSIIFYGDANYTLQTVEGYEGAYGFAVSDLNGTKSGEVTYQNAEISAEECHLSFAVDKTPPTGTLITEERTWNTFLTIITFGWYKKETKTLSATLKDITTPIDPASVYYLVTDAAVKAGGVGPTREDILAMNEWKQPKGVFKETGFEVCDIPEGTHVIYLRFKDYAGNETVISTDGTIVDFDAPEVTITAPNADENFIYNAEYQTVKLSLTAREMNESSFSGIHSMEYLVLHPGSAEWVSLGNIYTFDYERAEGQTSPYREQLVKEKTVEVELKTADYNYNGLKVKLVAKDNAGNTAEVVRTLNIDITAPQITVDYDNDTAQNERYFKEQRIATITVRERNFDAKQFNYFITSSSSAAPVIGAWTELPGNTANRDDTIHRTQVVFSADSDYAFDLARCTAMDKAGNDSVAARFADGTVAGEQFTVDKTNPEITVVYDNNEAKNGNFYKADRTATVTISERNFSEDLANVTLTAISDGQRIDLPQVSVWQKTGNAYTVTIPFKADGEYTFDIAVTDLAGNEAADYNKDSFVIDTVAPELKIEGVENETANNGEVKITVSYADLFVDGTASEVSAIGVMRGENALSFRIDETEKGTKYTFDAVPREREYDDIYTLTAVIADKAGNITEQTVRFSVNRFGSTYEIDEATKEIIDTYAKEPRDVVICEVNPNKLIEIEVTIYHDNETIALKEGEDYEVLLEGGDGQWHKYTYRIYSKNFDVDGTYRVTVRSKDEAGNIAENSLDTKNMDIRFGIDSKAPVITMGNLVDGKTYAVEFFTANMMVVDNGKLVEVVVYLDGVELKKWDAAALSSVQGEFTFDISDFSNSAHDVRIYARDAAGNEQEVLVEDFYVTTNLMVRYMNNKPLFYGSIAGVLAIIGLVIFLIVRRKKKEE